MKRTSATDAGRLDRQILTAMITSTRFLRDIQDIYSPEFMPGEYGRLVAQWCINHFQKHKLAPGRHIQDYFDRVIREKTVHDKDVLGMIEKLLTGISQDFERDGAGLNIDFLLDEAEQWWCRRDLENLSEDLRQTIENAGPEEARELLKRHVAVQRAGRDGFNPFRELNRLDTALEYAPTPLLYFPGALGQLLNRFMVRESLIGIMGPEKRGKSFWLTEFLLRSCIARNNTALFEVGDMTESQYLPRLFSRVTGLPPSRDDLGENEVPELDCFNNQRDTCSSPNRMGCGPCIREEGYEGKIDAKEVPPGYKPCHYCSFEGTDYLPAILYRNVKMTQELTGDLARQMADKINRRMGDRQLMVSMHPNFSINVAGIRQVLDRWKDRDGFIPDVIIIDYADILLPEQKGQDEREAQNERWAMLRQLSQVYHCLVVVATQTNRASYSAETITDEMSSEDKRKLAHVVGMLGLHRWKDEQSEKVMRLSWVLHRGTRYSVRDQVVCLQDLARCNPVVDSYWRPRRIGPRAAAKPD